MIKYKPEVLIYLNQVKSFLDKNEEARSYFMSNISPDIFYEKLCKISEQNFESSGEPNLTQNQFEELRLGVSEQTEKKVKQFICDPMIYTQFGSYSLN
jgi:hypothetical protein